MKKWASIATLAALAVISRGIVLLLVFGMPAALDVMIAWNRDRRYKFAPWPLTRRVCRLLFVSRAPAPLPIPVPPTPSPLGERHSRYIPNDVQAAVMRRDMGRCRQCGSTENVQYDHV
ncbi:MAG TPA: hypothetical protein VKG80_00295, partial [Trebonia sp.]|nr:hypothetical protein [Trebonia sp.]